MSEVQKLLNRDVIDGKNFEKDFKLAVNACLETAIAQTYLNTLESVVEHIKSQLFPQLITGDVDLNEVIGEIDKIYKDFEKLLDKCMDENSNLSNAVMTIPSHKYVEKNIKLITEDCIEKLQKNYSV